MGGKCSDNPKPLVFCTECIPGPPGQDGAPGKDGVSPCECCLPGMRAVLGFLKGLMVPATDIRIETIAPQPAANDVSITRFYPDANDASTAVLVEVAGGTIVSICEIELVKSASLLVSGTPPTVPPALQTALNATLPVPAACNKCCQEELRKLFQSKVGQNVSNIDTNRNNIATGTVKATGAGVVIIDVPGQGSEGNKGAAVNLCHVSSVKF